MKKLLFAVVVISLFHSGLLFADMGKQSKSDQILKELDTPGLLLPKNNSVNVSVFPDLVWSKIQGASTYRLQFGLEPDCKGISTLIRDTIYTFDTRLMVSTQYFWRIRVENRDGNDYISDTSQWSSVNSFTTLIAPLDAPVIYSPQVSYNVPITQTFKWYEVEGADSYQFQVSEDTDFKTFFLDTQTVNTEIIYTFDYKTKYYYRLCAKNSEGESPWTITGWILTKRQFESPPKLISPINEGIKIPINGEMKWGSYYGGDLFHLQVSKVQDFSNNVVDTILAEMNYNYFNLEYGTYYFWHVQAYSKSDTSGWCATWIFRTKYDILPNLPEQVKLLSPENESTFVFWINSGDIGVDGDPFIWEPGGTTQIDKYAMEFSEDSSFINPEVMDDLKLPYMYPYHPQGYSKGYSYWRVRAANEAGWGPYSEIRKLYIQTVGVNENIIDIENNVSISPNPAKDIIKFSLQEANTDIFVSIFNSIGNEVKRADYNEIYNNECEISITDLPSGIYYCKITTGIKIITLKFIKL